MADAAFSFDFPKLPTAQELYNSLMSAIEPDLPSTNIPLLEKKYKDETAEQHVARMERYQKAFDEYDKEYETYMAKLTTDLAAHRTQANKTMEKRSQSRDGRAMEDLEASMQTL